MADKDKKMTEGGPSSSQEETNERRLWIGNLDIRVTEFRLMKLLQSFGKLEKFDMLFHRTGPLAGQPRGYAFVTYKDKANAAKCMSKLNASKLGTRVIVVKYAHNMSKEEMEKSKVNLNLPVLIGVKKDEQDKRELKNRMSKIQEIEAKLKMMEKSKEDLADTLLKKTCSSYKS
ncbi:probable RNA-binding protein 18 [Diaphorina citri]|uniref:Probable RNA-binding protein 18 n=1 Tax=Diaphorina citri TaxID=121845 RepID=A0A1S3CYG6_DIACI|nr:probable RNA-binding protein 18 [Diaphorina citri]XP_008487207.1 probable RNA-binding protein 18 [Diaphorina citri]